MSFASRGETLDSSGDGRPRIYAAAILLVLGCAIPWLIWGVIGALDSNSNDPRQWLPRGFDETAKYHWLQQHFGSDEMTVVSWPGCTLDNPRVAQLGRLLVEDPKTAYFDRAITGGQQIDKLMDPPVSLSRHEAIRRLRGVLVGPDNRTTCLILTISKRGAADREAAIEEVRRVAVHECGLAFDQIRLGGPTVDAAAIDVESQHMLLELAGLSGLVALSITWFRLRSAHLALIILACAVYCTGVALSILYYTGGNMNLVMTMLPPLIFVLSVSSAVHLTNYYRDALQEGAGDRAPIRALAAGWKPCTLASLTTAIGLFSLAVSDIIPVRMFGIYAAAGMVGSLAIVLLFLPSALLLLHPRPNTVPTHARHSLARSRGAAYMSWIQRHHAAVSITCVACMCGAAWGLPKLRSTVKLQYRFRADSRIIQDYRWLEENLGPLVPLEIVVHFSGDDQPAFLDQLSLVASIDTQLARQPGIGAVVSGADLVPFLPRGGSMRNVAMRAVMRRRAPELQEALRAAHYFATGDNHESLWRISVRAPALTDMDYGNLVETLQAKIDPVIAAKLKNTRLTYTGVIPLIYKAQHELLNDLVESFFMAFVVIALVLMIALHGVRAGLLAMVPNVFPAILIFGLMGWSKIPIEIGSIMTASAAMGIAVDDTLHFLTWFRFSMVRGAPRTKSLQFAFERCAGAMLLTTLICAGGLLVFSLSTFMPIVRFAWLMASLLVIALVGDLVLLPALLAGPLGKLFAPRATPARKE